MTLLSWKTAVCFFCLQVFVPLSDATETIMTPAGLLIIRQIDSSELGTSFKVTLDGKTVIHTDESDNLSNFSEFPVPNLLMFARVNTASCSALAVFQQTNWGNACSGGPIWILSIGNDRTFHVSKSIDFCNGPAPSVSLRNGTIEIIIPSSVDKGKTDRRLSSEKWRFKDRALERVR